MLVAATINFLNLYNLLYGMNYGNVKVAESRLRSSTTDGLLNRHTGNQEFSGGGVCIFISKMHSIAIVNVKELYPELEICCLDLYHEDLKCKLFAIYRAPSSKDISILLEFLSAYSEVKFNSIIIGDANCPNNNWNTLKAEADST